MFILSRHHRNTRKFRGDSWLDSQDSGNQQLLVENTEEVFPFLDHSMV